MFKAIVIDKDDSGYRASLKDVDDSALPVGDVTVRVAYSTINYKDGLALTGKAPVVRKFPLHAGIDFAGTVESSDDARFKPGDAVLLNGFGVGESHSGGLAQKARVKADWLVPLPAGLSARQAMAIGTAGYTAMLCVTALERHGVQAGDGEVLVTGATGGVGSVAVALLSKLGHRVVAATGKAAEADYLARLGAVRVIDRAELAAPGKPLQKERWTAVVDAVGSHTLVNACAQVRYGGAVAACGLAQGFDFPATVVPFILRGVALLGVDSVMAPPTKRQAAWARLAKDLDPALLEAIINEVSLDEAVQAARSLLAGHIRGRVVVRIAG